MKSSVSTPTPAPAFVSLIAACIANSPQVVTGFAYTLGNGLQFPAATSISGVRFYAVYSGSGTDTYKVSVWVNGVRQASAIVSVTSTGVWSGTFATPVAVSAYDAVSVGVYCTSSSRFTNAQPTTGLWGKNNSTNRIKAPFFTGAYWLALMGGYSAAGDAEPTTESYIANGSIQPVEPF